ncbi:MAG: tRNA (N(6)-L-threonylcarbamoyladenosine(37)-C(2))-methylthiotransferase MtaB [Anaerolineales bacterium]|nr:tRNA (N(6)-L-threonylcarbamoyladenosine(37)-C(2))-methylthiotransferase MtaB [Anaerolineales bacterium]
MKVFIHSIGCRLNHSEMETLARQLMAAEHEIVADAAVADHVVINTCAVTAEAARDARQTTRRIHRTNDTAEITLTGCYATIAPQELEVLPGVRAVVHNAQKEQIGAQLDSAVGDADVPVFDQEPILRDFLGTAVSHTRAFIKVQDGCNNKCTFCVTTIARGEGQSRHLGDIVAEIQHLAAAGYQEAVLSGVHLGSYGYDFGNQAGLRDLVEAILKHTDIPRLRLSSLEPWDIAPGFFELWEDPRLLPHLHLPLQSGSDRILQRMARRTKRESFREIVNDARTHIADLNLTTDIIVGFPGETEEDFQESLEFVREIGFSRLHAFSYSQRPGTAAAKMAGQLPKALKKERVNRMITLAEELGREFHQQYEGQTVNVLWESAVGADENGVRWSGYTDNYVRVIAHGPAEMVNQVTTTQITATDAHGMQGVVVV